MKRLLVVVAFLLPAFGLTAQQQPSLNTVLDRASDYVADFNRQFSAIVAEEEYEQYLADVGQQPHNSHRVLRSDLLLVLASDVHRYVDFRDVFEVDGLPVRDREERLTKLFLEGGANSGRFRQIVDESSRYNLGRAEGMVRTVNAPTLVLRFLEASQRSRFRFNRTNDRKVALADREIHDGGRALFSASTELWVVEFREIVPGTIIRTPEGRDAPSRGRLWIEPSSGRVMMTELLVRDSRVRATIDVTYQSKDTIGPLVPVQMRERYEAKDLLLTGTATYSNFRQFGVTVNETLRSR